MFFHDFTDALEVCVLTYGTATVLIRQYDDPKKREQKFVVTKKDVETKSERYNAVVQAATQNGVLVTIQER